MIRKVFLPDEEDGNADDERRAEADQKREKDAAAVFGALGGALEEIGDEGRAINAGGARFRLVDNAVQRHIFPLERAGELAVHHPLFRPRRNDAEGKKIRAGAQIMREDRGKGRNAVDRGEEGRGKVGPGQEAEPAVASERNL